LVITASLFSFCLLKARHKDEFIQETLVLKTVKEWITADFETWEKVLKNKDEGELSYHSFRGRGEKQGSKKEQEIRRDRRSNGGKWREYMMCDLLCCRKGREDHKKDSSSVLYH
jgi:hypothetical protein